MMEGSRAAKRGHELDCELLRGNLDRFGGAKPDRSRQRKGCEGGGGGGWHRKCGGPKKRKKARKSKLGEVKVQ